MSVMACARNGCDAIMCDNLVLGSRAYLCNDCLAELKVWRKTWSDTTEVQEVETKIRKFIASRKKDQSQIPTLLREKVEAEFLRLIGEEKS